MKKDELEVKINTLQKVVLEKNQELITYSKEIESLNKELSDLNKPKLTNQQFEAMHQAIEDGIGEFDFDDDGNYSIDYGIDYDGRVHCESFCFDGSTDLEHNIVQKLEQLFAVEEEDASDNS